MIGIGRVKTPTLGIVCLRELEIRNFRPEEDRVKGRDAVVILGRTMWEQEFGSDPGVLGLCASHT